MSLRNVANVPPAVVDPKLPAAEGLFPACVQIVSGAAEDLAAVRIHPLEARCVAAARAERRREFLAGRRCARAALARLGIADFPLLPNPDRTPRWPPGIAGSLTHCRGYVAAAVAPTKDLASLGLDVECVTGAGSELQTRICTERERDRSAELARRLPVDWLTLHFSAKESFYKSYFPLARRFLDFLDVEIDFDPADRSFLIHPVEPIPLEDHLNRFRGRFAIDSERVYTAVSVLPAQV